MTTPLPFDVEEEPLLPGDEEEDALVRITTDDAVVDGEEEADVHEEFPFRMLLLLTLVVTEVRTVGVAADDGDDDDAVSSLPSFCS